MKPSAHSVPRPTAAGITLTVGGLAAGWALTAALVVAARSTWATAARPAARADEVIAALSTTAATAVSGWLCLGASLSAAVAVQRGAGRSARRTGRLAESIAPTRLRHALAVSIGLSLAAVTIPAQAAVEGSPSAPPRAAVDVSWGRVPAPPTPPAQAAIRARPAGAPARSVLVRPGDTLWGLAAQQLPASATKAEVAAAWPGWFAANREVIGPDPHRILPGQRLTPPPLTR